MTFVSEEIRKMVDDILPPSTLVVGRLYSYRGGIVRIVSGEYWGLHGISNFWSWCEVFQDGSYGPEQHGYDNKGEFKPLTD